MTMLASVDDSEPCTTAPPLATGVDCPRVQLPGVSPGFYEIAVHRGPNGFCTDGDNGLYQLHVTLNGTPMTVTPACDDCP